jgi:hypothetical protein
VGVLEQGRVGKFLVEKGNKIVVDPTPGLELGILRSCILGPLLAAALRQRGLLVLHASSVAVQDQAIAFMGHRGAGKSTTATSFQQQGYPLLTDDVTAIDFEGSQAQVMPGFPSVRLLPDAANSLGYTFAKLDPIHSWSPKRNHSLHQDPMLQAIPLRCLYILSADSASHSYLEPLDPQAAFAQLVCHSRVTNLLLHPDWLQIHLHQCTQIVNTIPIRLVRCQRSLSELSQLVQMILQDLGIYAATDADLACLAAVSSGRSRS